MKWSLGTIGTALAALGGGLAVARSTVEERYVHQSAYQLDRRTDSLTSRQVVDSIFRDLRSIRQSQSRTDSNITCLRHPKRKECQ